MRSLPGGVAPLLTRPTVLYHGPEAAALADRWNGPDRPFRLVGIDRTDDRPTDGPTVDCVILEVDDEDAETVLEWAERVAGPVPKIVLDVGDQSDSVLPAGADSRIAVSADIDRSAVLEALASLVERLVLTARDLSMFDSLLSNIPLSVYIKDRLGRHIAVSDSLLTMIGLPHIENEEGKRHHHPADIVGKTDFDLYDDDLAVDSAADDRSVVETGDPIENRIEDSHAERGRGTLVATSKAPWYDRTGDVGGSVGVTQDITERKHLEYQLRRQNRRLRRLTTMVSHDIRNPLSAAIGRLELARETGEAEHFDAVERSIERIERLVEDVLEVTRQGIPATETEQLALAAVARDVWETLDPAGATLRTPTDETVVADPDRLGLLLENLFVNAVEHGREGGSITVTVGDLPDREGFYVADDGAGIPPADRASVFEPGLSAADSSGIGLNVVSAIADAHGWTVDVAEGADGGARFEFRGVRLAGA